MPLANANSSRTGTNAINTPADPVTNRINYNRGPALEDEASRHKKSRAVRPGSHYKSNSGRPSITPGTYFRLLLVGYSRASNRSGAWHGARLIR
jgi:hypothetical protein